jgi:hypothetical protein
MLRLKSIWTIHKSCFSLFCLCFLGAAYSIRFDREAREQQALARTPLSDREQKEVAELELLALSMPMSMSMSMGLSEGSGKTRGRHILDVDNL